VGGASSVGGGVYYWWVNDSSQLAKGGHSNKRAAIWINLYTVDEGVAYHISLYSTTQSVHFLFYHGHRVTGSLA